MKGREMKERKEKEISWKMYERSFERILSWK
jgi:hypothetical protein